MKLSAVAEVVVSITRHLHREDRCAIQNRLFDQLFDGRISEWIETRPDKENLYQDLFDHAFAQISARSHVGRQLQLERFIPGIQSTDDEEDVDGYASDLESILDEDSPCEYMQPYNNFESVASQCRGLGTWVPMFMTEGDLYGIAPAMEHPCERYPGSLVTFTRYLNSNYICSRADDILGLFETGFGLAILDIRDAKAVVQAWNSAYGFSLRSSLTRVFLAFGLFRLSKTYANTIQGLLAGLDASDYHHPP
ncbi:hypothetical protein F5Y09DRAFT_339214 [Xylaria sp. FL1042]|nr:hypothetical protein F5Y09DRAFT_339214 [Xylaria sp. FL1042]